MGEDDDENTMVFKLPDTQVFRRRRASEQQALPTLRVVAGPDLLRFCSVSPGDRILIGRDESCDLPLLDPSVSRRHATVHSDASGRLHLEDLGSTNGTSYRGEPVHGAVEVQVGEEIVVGNLTLKLERMGLDELSHLAQVVERLNQATKDSLTGLLGRRYLDDELPKQLRRYRRARVAVCAIFLDVDHFKQLNDSLGHAAGDEVLRTVARLLVLCVRDSDHVARYGGEEFVLVLPNCDAEGGRTLAERVRYRIASYDWTTHLGAEVQVTVSLGVAAYEGEDSTGWLERADAAMYEAKSAGRNQVRMAPPAG